VAERRHTLDPGPREWEICLAGWLNRRQQKVIDEMLVSLLTGGHALLEGVPGLAKTMLIGVLAKAAGLESCVAPTSEMRRNHMDYLKHDRIKVVREGVRDVKSSLAGCIDCHAEC